LLLFGIATIVAVQGANLNSAKLDGANLTKAELDGAQLVTARLLSNPTPSYRSALVTLLGNELASASFVIATGIALRVSAALEGGSAEDRLLYAAVACRLVANARLHDVVLEPQDLQQLESECEQAQAAAR
jgi:uncharacterized protein YjbI with pentapeptide repeats